MRSAAAAAVLRRLRRCAAALPQRRAVTIYTYAAAVYFRRRNSICCCNAARCAAPSPPLSSHYLSIYSVLLVQLHLPLHLPSASGIMRCAIAFTIALLLTCRAPPLAAIAAQLLRQQPFCRSAAVSAPRRICRAAASLLPPSYLLLPCCCSCNYQFVSCCCCCCFVSNLFATIYLFAAIYLRQPTTTIHPSSGSAACIGSATGNLQRRSAVRAFAARRRCVRRAAAAGIAILRIAAFAHCSAQRRFGCRLPPPAILPLLQRALLQQSIYTINCSNNINCISLAVIAQLLSNSAAAVRSSSAAAARRCAQQPLRAAHRHRYRTLAL